MPIFCSGLTPLEIFKNEMYFKLIIDYCTFLDLYHIMLVSKEFIDIIIFQLFREYSIKGINMCIHSKKILTHMVIYLPQFLSYDNYSFLFGYSTIFHFNSIYKLLFIDIITSASTNASLTFLQFKKIYTDILHNDTIENNAIVIDDIHFNMVDFANSFVLDGGAIYFEENMEILCKDSKLLFNDTFDKLIQDPNIQFSLENINNYSFEAIIAFMSIKTCNSYWFSLLLSNFSTVCKYSINYCIIEKFINFNDMQTFHMWGFILSSPTNIDYILSTLTIEQCRYCIEAHTNSFYSNLYKSSGTLDQFGDIYHSYYNLIKSNYFYKYIIQLAILLKVFISKFDNIVDAYNYISENGILSTNKNVYIALVLLKIYNGASACIIDIHETIIKEIIYFAGSDDIGFNNYGNYLSTKHNGGQISSGKYIGQIIENMLVYWYTYNKSLMRVFLEKDEIQNLFYNNQIFHKFYSNYFYQLLPDGYKVKISHPRCYSSFCHMLIDNYYIDNQNIFNYLLLVWKSFAFNYREIKYKEKKHRDTKYSNNAIKYSAKILEWIIKNNHLDIFNLGHLFHEYTNIIKCALNRSEKTNYNFFYSLIEYCKTNEIDGLKYIKSFILEYVKFKNDNHIKLLLIHSIANYEDTIEYNQLVQSRINLLKWFHPNILSIYKECNLSKSKKMILDKFDLVTYHIDP